MDSGNLTTEQKARVLACKSPDEILNLAKEEGIELTDDQLEQVTGGWGSDITCPKCGGHNVDLTQVDPHSPILVRDCLDCGYSW